MKDKKFKCWTKIRKILNEGGYSYVDMFSYLSLMDISKLWREFEEYILQILNLKPKELRKFIKNETKRNKSKN